MVKYYFLSFLLASIWSCIGYGQTFKVQNFDHKTEIGTNIINTLAEDENGYIWIGTEGLGIARYNGTSFQYYNNVLVKDGLHVKSISFDTDKNIYIGSYNTGFFHSHIDSLANVRLHPDSKSPSVYYVEKKEDRTIIAGLDILTLYSGGQIINQITFEKGDAPKIYNTLKLPSFTILLTNRGNFVVDAYEITPLDQWLGTEKELANNCIHAFHENNKITLLTKDGKRSVNVFLNDEQAKFFYIDTLKQTTPFLPNEFITYSDRSQQYSYFITNLGRVFKSDGHVSALLKSNFKESIRVPTGIIVDRNENLWVSSRIQGLFKFSKCAFTPVNFNKDLKEPDIIFYHEFNDSVIVFTRDNDQSTLIGFQNQESPFTSYPFRVYSHSQQNSTHFFGTTHGVYKYENAKLVNAIPALKNKMCFISKKNEEEFFIYEKEKGLYTFHLKKGLNYLKNQPEENIDFLYTGSKVPGENSYFFGGIGCTQLLKNEKWYNLTPSFKNKGAANTYVHSIPDDKRKILWLMSPSSLVGYHPNGELQIIDKLSWIKSTVVYDAILDEAGNLILGTANGIVYLELNEKGFPVYSTLYGNREGYEVYEVNYNTITHVGEGLYRFATLEGVYTLDVKELPLYHTPKAPIVDQIRIANQQIKYGGKGTYITLKDNEEVLIQYNVINPQSSVVYYSYRINDKNNGTWSVWSRENSSLISSALGPGIYQLEIRASFNKKTSSPISNLELVVKRPFFKSQSFIGSLILLLLILNITYLVRRKNHSVDQMILSKDLHLQSKSAGFLMIFGALTILLVFNTAHLIVTDLPYFPILTWIPGGITLILGLGVLMVPNIRKSPQIPTVIGYLLVLGYNLVGCQLTNLHPLYILGVVLTLIVTPIVITKFSQIISVCIIVLTSSFFIVYTVEGELLFSDVFFIVDIFITLFLVIITTYVRNDALEKLIFTSGVINNEDFLVASFKPNQEIVYLNETFKYLLPRNLESYINKNISELSVIETFNQNPFNKVVLEEFRDKHMFNITLELNTGELKHFQFACKVFKNKLRVIIGQDITEKIELEKYYEVIVNNSQDLIYRLDISGHLTFVNKQCEKTLGIKSKDVIGNFYTSVVHPEWREEVLDFYSHQFKKRIKNTYSEIPILTKNGSTIWLGQHMTAIFKEGDEKVITGYLGIGRNITDRRRKDEIINNQNKDIRDSLNYAKRIQMNLIPDADKVAQHFKESFVYFSPKDIVSGDFYWIERLQNKTVLITADCTGHGVPGAFMTLLGINLLNQIILENKIIDAGEILNQLDLRLTQALRRNKSEVLNDGMECTVCIFDDENNELEYAVSGSKFFLVQNKEIKEVNGTSSHIGEGHALSTPYQSTKIPFLENDVIYLFSDGIVDQFGGEKGKKLKKSRFINLIDSVQELPMAAQEKAIKNFMADWMKNEEQTDDICLIAVKREGANRL